MKSNYQNFKLPIIKLQIPERKTIINNQISSSRLRICLIIEKLIIGYYLMFGAW